LLMFSTGFVVTIISILRLQVLVNFGGSSNFTCTFAFSLIGPLESFTDRV
jgi:hypothetical protein